MIKMTTKMMVMILNFFANYVSYFVFYIQETSSHQIHRKVSDIRYYITNVRGQI
jgi:hypothetical protein